MKQRNIRRTLLALALSAFGAGTMAQGVVNEQEPNNNVRDAQLLEVDSSGSVTVNGYIGSPTTTGTTPVSDVDFYKFEGREGDPIVINIDGAYRGPSASKMTSLDSVLTLFGPGPTYRFLRENDDTTCDAGSLCTKNSTGAMTTRDARIDNIRLPATGTYYLAVTTAEVYFSTYSSFRRNLTRTNGPYTLKISGLTPPVQIINIDIKPGSGDSAPMNKKAQGNVPVALLGSKDFDPFKIDVNSLRFGVIGDEQSLRRCGNDPVDVDSDGYMDRVCHFDNQTAMEKWVSPDLEAMLTGSMIGGRRFQGTGRLKIVPAPKTDD